MLKERPSLIFGGEGSIYKRWPDQYAQGSGNWPKVTEAELRGVHNAYFNSAQAYPNNTFIMGYTGLERIWCTKRDRYMKVFNDCDHMKTITTNLPFTMFYTDNNVRRSLRFYRMDMDLMPGLDYGAVTSYATLPKEGYADQLFSNRAYHHMLPKFEGTVNMLNFLFELKDFRDISKAATKLFRGNPKLSSPDYLRNQLSKLNRPGKRRANSALSDNPNTNGGWEPTQVASGLMLFGHFGVEPLIRDCADIMTQAGIMASKAFDRFVAKGVELDYQSRHYTEWSNISEVDYWKADFFPGIRYYNNLERLRRTATMQYRYEYSPRDPRDVFRRFWGLDWNWDTYWNMIPWTFLFDYFVKFGKALEAVDHDKNLLIDIHQYCESRKLIKQAGKFYTDKWNNSGGFFCLDRRIEGDNRFLITGVSRVHYTRVKKQPSVDGLYVPLVKLPSTKQGLNMLALARLFV